jgi:hypothetical protein
MLSPGQLASFRAAAGDEASGQTLRRAIASLGRRGIDVDPGGAKPLLGVPRGVAADHPNADLLRWKGMIARQRPSMSAIGELGPAVDAITGFWDAAAPLSDRLDAHVGRADPQRRW